MALFAPPSNLAARAVSPSRLRLSHLLCITDRYAEDVLDGRFDHLQPAGGLPTDSRWYSRLHTDDDLDVWLISWVPGHSTELHDHGGSIGALTVLTGALNEYRWGGETLLRRRLDAGDQAAFPLGWVHDVDAVDERQTLSVHAYSPPLTAMSFYEVTDRQRLRRVRSELTTAPEAG